jgi:hypothetical protein
LPLSAFVKAAARDTKSYLKSISSSALVGYAAVDGDADFRNTVAEYFTCGEEEIVVDLYGEWIFGLCGLDFSPEKGTRRHDILRDWKRAERAM